MDKEFAESYNTDEWQRKRNWILLRDRRTCQICGEHGMEVHHITYKHCDGKAYNALDGELITLCRRCHRHDDGDHINFFNGKYTLVVGEEKPFVLFNLDERKQIRYVVERLLSVITFAQTKFERAIDILRETEAEQEWIPEMGNTVYDNVREHLLTLERINMEINKIIMHVEEKWHNTK